MPVNFKNILHIGSGISFQTDKCIPPRFVPLFFIRKAVFVSDVHSAGVTNFFVNDDRFPVSPKVDLPMSEVRERIQKPAVRNSGRFQFSAVRKGNFAPTTDAVKNQPNADAGLRPLLQKRQNFFSGSVRTPNVKLHIDGTPRRL